MRNNNWFKINLIYFIIIFSFVLIRMISSLGLLDFIENPFIISRIFTLIIQVGLMGFFPIVLYMVLFKTSILNVLKDFSFNKVSFRVIIFSLVIGIIAFIVNIIVSNIFANILYLAGYSPVFGSSIGEINTILRFLSTVFFVAFLPAIFEEITHRGLLISSASKEVGYKRALIISSLLFGLMHLNVGQFFYATFMGLLIGVVLISSGSIIPAIIVHFTNNFINIYLSFARSNNLYGQNFYSNISNTISNSSTILTFVTTVLLLSLFLMIIISLLFKMYRESKLHYFKFSEGDKDVPLPGTVSDVIFPKTSKDDYKYGLSENLFLYGSLFLGITVTIFTFIWGVL